MRRIRLVLAPLDNHEIAFGCESVTAAPPSSRRPPCFPAFPAVARGALSLRFARSADPRLLKCRKMRPALAHAHRLAWSGIPHPTPIGAPSRRITHPVTWAHSGLLSRFSLLCRAISRVIPGFFLRRYRAFSAAQSAALSNFGLKDKNCTQSVQASIDCDDSQNGTDRQIARANEEHQTRGRGL